VHFPLLPLPRGIVVGNVCGFVGFLVDSFVRYTHCELSKSIGPVFTKFGHRCAASLLTFETLGSKPPY